MNRYKVEYQSVFSVSGFLMLVVVVLTLAFSCDSSTSQEEGEDISNITTPCEGCKKVLFIGSSYLGYNEMPQTFSVLCDTAGQDVYVDTSIIYGSPLSFHCTFAQTLDKIAAYPWDFVVLQDSAHPISDPKWHGQLVPFIETLDGIIKEHHAHATTVYMMPWGYKDGLLWMGGEDETYMELQQQIRDQSVALCQQMDLALSPVGWAWRHVIQTDPTTELYLADMSHPNRQGSYLTACVFYVTFFGTPLENIPFYDVLMPDEATYFQSVASDIVLNDLESWNLNFRNP